MALREAQKQIMGDQRMGDQRDGRGRECPDAVVHRAHQQPAQATQVTRDQEAGDLALSIRQQLVAAGPAVEEDRALGRPLTRADNVRVGLQAPGAGHGSGERLLVTIRQHREMLKLRGRAKPLAHVPKEVP
jgi:hypothetical protein